MDKLKAGFHQSFIEGDRWLMYVKGIGVTLEVAAVALLLGIVLGGSPYAARPAAAGRP